MHNRNAEVTDMQKGPKRPLMIWCMLYLAMLAVFFLLSVFFVLQVLVLFVLTVGFSVCAYLCSMPTIRLPDLLSSRSICVGAIIAIVMASVSVFWTMRDYRALQTDTETTVEIRGVVERTYYATDSGASLLIDLDTVNGKKNRGKIRIESEGSAIYANEGEIVSFTAVLGKEELTAEYRDNIIYAFPDGIYAYALVQESLIVHGTKISFSRLCDSIAAVCRRQLYRYLPEDAAEMCISILLGDKSVLSAEVRRDFRRVGVSHILAVSGLHLSVLNWGILFVMKKGGVSFRARYLIMLLLIVTYMGVTGFSPSVTRAGVMWILICLAELLHRDTDALISLFVAAALLCFVNPQAVFDIGFLLSLSATLGLIVLMPPLNVWMHGHAIFRIRSMRPVRAAITVWATTVAASAFTAPITLLVFGELSTLAPISNALLHIPVAVLLYCTPIFLLISLLGEILPLGALIRFTAGAIAGDTALITDLTALLSRLPHALIGVRYWFTVVLLAVFVISCAVLLWRRKSMMYIYPAYGGFLLALFISVQINAAVHRGNVLLTYAANGKNDNVAVITDGRGMIIDASDGSWSNLRLSWAGLSAQNLTELDVIALTHYHSRHTTMLYRLACNTVVGTLLLPEPITDEEAAIAERLQSLAESMKIAVSYYRRGEDEIRFGNAVLQIFAHETLSRSTQPLLGWHMTANGEDVVYLGAAAFEADDNSAYAVMRDDRLANCEVLLVGMHGPLYKEDFPLLTERAGALSAAAAANTDVKDLLGDALGSIPISLADGDGAIRILLK